MAAADEIGYDIFEQIFIRLGVEDLTRCKCVSKSLYSSISTPCFVESHLKQLISTYNNDPKRITGKGMSCYFLLENKLFVVGSANGLVCVSPEALQLLVVNPCTRQTIKILEPPPEPVPQRHKRWDLVWGFGYDSSSNDYKIVLGFQKPKMAKYRTRSKKKKNKTYIRLVKTGGSCTRFYVLSLKTCLWKFVGESDYGKSFYNTVSGVFCDGALHWHMMNFQTRELTILSFDLSRDKIRKTRLPDGHSQLESPHIFYTLGVMGESLCLYFERPPTKIWVLRRDSISGKQSWVLLPNNYVMNDDAVYLMNDDYSVDDTPYVLSKPLEYIAAPIYVRSLVSPHVNIDFSSKFVSGR